MGRHVVAERDIPVGHIVGLEEATVWRLLPSPQLRRICCHCMRESHNPLPCTKCAAVRYLAFIRNKVLTQIRKMVRHEKILM